MDHLSQFFSNLNWQLTITFVSLRFQQSLDLMKRLPNASWIAIDEEMTGIMLPGGMAKRPSKDETPAARYPSLKLVPERYAIIQLGICLFEQTGKKDPENGGHASFHVVCYSFQSRLRLLLVMLSHFNSPRV
jgi:hypothetical protein